MVGNLHINSVVCPVEVLVVVFYWMLFWFFIPKITLFCLDHLGKYYIVNLSVHDGLIKLKWRNELRLLLVDAGVVTITAFVLVATSSGRAILILTAALSALKKVFLGEKEIECVLHVFFKLRGKITILQL